MRLALLSTLGGSPEPAGVRPAFRQFAGARIIDRQIDLALAAGCETIACLVDGISKEITKAQQRAEQAGVRFVAMEQARALSGLVRAQDEILVLAAGLLPADEVVLRMARSAVLAFPAAGAVEKGYERLDLEFAWAGVLLAPGVVVERLAELPPDSDVISAILRISLQSGVRIHPIEKRHVEEGEWHLNPTIQELKEREEDWIRAHAEPAPFTAPGLAVAERVGARLAQDAIGGKGARIPGIAAILAATAAMSAASLGFAMTSLSLGALMAVLGAITETVDRIGKAGQFGTLRSTMSKTVDWMMDPVLVLVIALASPEETGWLRLFVPIILFGLMRLGHGLRQDRWRFSYQDRVFVSLLLVPCAFLGIIQPVVAVLALICLITLFLVPSHGE